MSSDQDTATWHRVRLHGDGRAFAQDEDVRGHSTDEAIANAEHQWPRSRVEYLGEDALLPAQVHTPSWESADADLADELDDDEDDVDQVLLPTRDEVFGDAYRPLDWWGVDHPDGAVDRASA